MQPCRAARAFADRNFGPDGKVGADEKAPSVPTTMTRPAMARSPDAVDSVLLGPGTTPRQLDRK